MGASGTLQTNSDKVTMWVSGDFKSEVDIRAITLRANDRFYRLSEIATVTRGYVEPWACGVVYAIGPFTLPCSAAAKHVPWRNWLLLQAFGRS